MDYKKAVIEMVEKIEKESLLKRLYRFVLYIYCRE